MLLRHLALLAVLVTVAWAQGRPRPQQNQGGGGGGGGGRELIRPDPQACKNRIKHAATFRDGHYYFFSWSHGPTSQHERDWLDARNICRKHCQDTVSIETEEEERFIADSMAKANVKYIWTSGRKCNFEGCDRPDLQPTIINGWFWSGSNKRIPAVNSTFGWRGAWSHTGGANTPQPDNREFQENGNDESCIAILNNFYNDGIVWHDVACNHVKPWVCEDSEELLNFAKFTYPNAGIQ